MQNIKNYGASVVPFTTDFSLSQRSKKNKEKKLKSHCMGIIFYKKNTLLRSLHISTRLLRLDCRFDMVNTRAWQCQLSRQFKSKHCLGQPWGHQSINSIYLIGFDNYANLIFIKTEIQAFFFAPNTLFS